MLLSTDDGRIWIDRLDKKRRDMDIMPRIKSEQMLYLMILALQDR
jgi:hypothetical protein